MEKITPQRVLRAVLWRGQRVINWLRARSIYARDAQKLARALFADVSQLDEQEVNRALDRMHEFGEARGHNQEYQELWDTHVYRMILSEKWIADAMTSIPDDGRAMDLGAESLTSDYWRYKFPKVRWGNTENDLRLPWNSPASSVDLIVCTELIEHLSDPPNVIFNEGFYKRGVVSVLQEGFKALKPGGYLFLTTPNAASLLHIKAVLQGDPPWFFNKHVREYTMPEVVALLQEAGFEIVRKHVIHCMSVRNVHHMTDLDYAEYSDIFLQLLENSYPVEGRGDDLFILARKPE
jgi:SAM-dependent methyltransferase